MVGGSPTTTEEEEEAQEDGTGSSDSWAEKKDPPPVYILLFCFMFLFQGYGAMVGNPQHALKEKIGVEGEDQAKAFQDATACFQLTKLVMRVAQIAFLAFLQPNGIVYISYVVMFVALLVPLFLVWGAGVSALWAVYLQYGLGGIGVGLFEGTFLSVISSLGKNTKTFVIMGAPLGFAVCNIVLGTLSQLGMPAWFYYLYTALCLPIAMAIFYWNAPAAEARSQGKGCQVFLDSLKHADEWLPKMVPWFIAKFVGNFVLEDGFPLLFNTFNTGKVPLFGGPSSTSGLVPFAYYAAWYWFPMMAAGDTISRRVPAYIKLNSWKLSIVYLLFAIVLCVGGEALDFLLIGWVTGVAAFISNFGNGFIYGLSAKFIDAHIPEEHRYTSYNLWCFAGDLGGYAGQSSLSVNLAHQACRGRHYKYVCHESPKPAPAPIPSPPPAPTAA